MTPAEILRNGLRQLIEHGAPVEIIENVANELAKQQK